MNWTFAPATINLSPNGSGTATLKVSVSAKPATAAAQPGGRVDGPQGVTDTPAAQLWGIGFMVFVMLLIAANYGAHHSAHHERFGRYVRGLAWSLVLAAAVTAMVSCGGSASSGGGGGNSVTFPLVVQAQANSSSTNLQTISITVP